MYGNQKTMSRKSRLPIWRFTSTIAHTPHCLVGFLAIDRLIFIAFEVFEICFIVRNFRVERVSHTCCNLNSLSLFFFFRDMWKSKVPSVFVLNPIQMPIHGQKLGQRMIAQRRGSRVIYVLDSKYLSGRRSVSVENWSPNMIFGRFLASKIPQNPT